MSFASGFRVTATDQSAAGVAFVEQRASELGLHVAVRVCDFTDDVFPPGSFDIVVATNVIYHGTMEQAAQAVSNVRRWLRRRGLFSFTFPSFEDERYLLKHGRARELLPHFVELEPGHRHCCIGKTGLVRLLNGFEILTCDRCDHHWEDEGGPQFSSRWRVLAERSAN